MNLGSGQARSFNDLARLVIAALGAGSVEYIPFDAGLSGRYQSFTEAELASLRAAGYVSDGGAAKGAALPCTLHVLACQRARGDGNAHFFVARDW